MAPAGQTRGRQAPGAPACRRPGPTMLKGRVAVVTGATRGIGRAIVRRLATDGADCVLTYRRSEPLAREAVAEIEGLGRRGLALPLDLGEPVQVGPAFERIAEVFGRVDILIANAAATAFRPMLDQRPHNVERTFAISVESFVAAVRAAVPLMTGATGRIVVISGIDSHQAMTGHGVLGAANSSRRYVEEGLGREFGAATAALLAATPVRRLGTVEDVTGLVAYLVSDAAGFLTGQTILIDGGLTLVSPLNRLAETDAAGRRP